MAFPNVLPDPNDDAEIERLRWQQDEMIKEYKRKRLEELRARGEGTSSGGHVSTLYESQTRALMGQAKIVAKGR